MNGLSVSVRDELHHKGLSCRRQQRRHRAFSPNILTYLSNFIAFASVKLPRLIHCQHSLQTFHQQCCFCTFHHLIHHSCSRSFEFFDIMSSSKEHKTEQDSSAEQDRPQTTGNVHPNSAIYHDAQGVRHEIYIPARDYYKTHNHLVNKGWDELAKFPKYSRYLYLMF